MDGAILLTGRPGCGKTTVIKRVVAQLACTVGGFYTEEIRSEGVRRGFRMVTFDGHVGILAHESIGGPPRVGKYGVDLESLEKVGVASVQRALETADLIVIDEVGPMEMFSEAFCQTVLAALESDKPVLGTVVLRSKPFSDRLKARSDVRVIEVLPGNREALVVRVVEMLRAGDQCDTM
jgi:nucleoside-triphosphatase